MEIVSSFVSVNKIIVDLILAQCTDVRPIGFDITEQNGFFSRYPKPITPSWIKQEASA